MGTGASKQGANGAGTTDAQGLLQRTFFDDGTRENHAAQAGAGAAAEEKLSPEETKKLWLNLIKTNQNKAKMSGSLQSFIKSHREDFKSDDVATNPLLWQDEQGNNALHLLLGHPSISELGVALTQGETTSALFELLTINSEYTGNPEPLLQKNGEGKNAFELGSQDGRFILLSQAIDPFSKSVSGFAYLAKAHSRASSFTSFNFLSQACLKRDEDGNSLLHYAARNPKIGDKEFIALQELSSKQAKSVAETAKRGEMTDLQNPSNTRNNKGESVLEVAIKSGNSQAVSSLVSGSLLSPGKKDTFLNKAKFAVEKVAGEVTTSQGIVRDLNERNSRNERPIDLLNPENFPLLTLKNRALFMLQENVRNPSGVPAEYEKEYLSALNSGLCLIRASENLGGTQDDKTEKNPVYQFLKLGLFDLVLEYVEKCDISVLRDESGVNIRAAIIEAEKEFIAECRSGAKDGYTTAAKSEALGNVTIAIDERARKAPNVAAREAGEGTSIFDNSDAGTSPQKPTAQRQTSVACVLQ